MTTEYGKLIGQRVKLLREKLGWSQTELAEKIGVHDAGQIIRYEKEKTPSAGSQIIYALAFHLETSADYLLGLTNDPTPPMVNEDLSQEEREVIFLMRRNAQARDAIKSVVAVSQGSK